MKHTDLRALQPCPFDKSHLIQPSKMLKHIQKCKSDNRRNFQPCPFNPIHWINFRYIDEHKQQCPDRDRHVSTFQMAHQRPMAKKQKQNHGSSFISQIPVNHELDESSEIYQLGLDFEMNKPPKNEIERNIKKKINKKEMKELNRSKIWQEPNFADWYDSNYDYQNARDRYGNRIEREERYLIQDDF